MPQLDATCRVADHSACVQVDYNRLQQPANYVPGLGRGATGFTTRSDIGPARMAPEMPSGLPVRPGSARWARACLPGTSLTASPAQAGKGADKKEDNKDEAPTVDETKFDEFMGNDAGAFAATGEYDQDDRQAPVSSVTSCTCAGLLLPEPAAALQLRGRQYV